MSRMAQCTVCMVEYNCQFYIDLHTAHPTNFDRTITFNIHYTTLWTLSPSLCLSSFSFSLFRFHSKLTTVTIPTKFRYCCTVETDYYKIGHFSHSIEFEYHCKYNRNRTFSIEICLKFNSYEFPTRNTHGKLCKSYSNTTLSPPLPPLLLLFDPRYLTWIEVKFHSYRFSIN